jgi:hypothetical protein
LGRFAIRRFEQGGWDTSDRFLFATRIEHVTAFLSQLYP